MWKRSVSIGIKDLRSNSCIVCLCSAKTSILWSSSFSLYFCLRFVSLSPLVSFCVIFCCSLSIKPSFQIIPLSNLPTPTNVCHFQVGNLALLSNLPIIVQSSCDYSNPRSMLLMSFERKVPWAIYVCPQSIVISNDRLKLKIMGN